MRMFLLFAATAFAVAISALTGRARANLYCDENFEGMPFAPNAWPYHNDAEPVSPQMQALQGLELLANSSDTAYQGVTLAANEGEVTDERYFQGARSYRLASGQKLAVGRAQFPTQHIGWYRIWQFALAVDANAAAQSAGTIVGYFQESFSTNPDNKSTPTDDIRINLVANGRGGVDIQCSKDPSATALKTIEGKRGHWALLTIVQQHATAEDGRADSPQKWVANGSDGKWKGPLPSVPLDTLNVETADEDFYQMPTGYNIFVDSTASPRLTIGRDVLGEAWGTGDGSETPQEISWEFAAANGGALYIDDLYWSGGGFDSYGNLMFQEFSRRLDPFDLTSAEGPPIAAACPAWMLY
jgi:hypothetical protein